MRKNRLIPISGTLASTVISLLLVSVHIPQAEDGTVPSDDEKWTPSPEQEEIHVEVFQEPGQSLKAFRASTLVKAPLITVLAVFRDLKHRQEWLKNSVETKVLERMGSTDYILYEHTRLRLISDRDSVILVTTRANLQKKRVELLFETTIHKDMPEQHGIVRMPKVKGHFYFYPEKQGTATLVEYQAYADPGGSLPPFLVNWAAKTVPYDTLLALKDQVQKPQDAELTRFIQNLPGYQQLMAATSSSASVKESPSKQTSSLQKNQI